MDNAIKYSPGGGEVIVSARCDAGFLIISITDQGQGISPADQIRLFKSFERLEETTSEDIRGS